ncbi:DUF1566 domain-containing protein [Sulfurimonas sp.]|uniref:Lcl C-terminal domain-containing protein n=1 Tax=Sulfurimonas sp. TaxID=2022749 RepID=UPI00263335ED|nr:DUF1566 domain-containing protein [Sulfurimonas sp.]
MKYILLLLISVIVLNAKDNEPLVDAQQHLMWGVCTEQTNPDQTYPWRFGKSFCDNSYKYGYSDWRLPRPQEIQKSIENGTLKKIRLGSYWTSSVDPKAPEDNALAVYSNGHVHALEVCGAAYALCVR